MFLLRTIALVPFCVCLLLWSTCQYFKADQGTKSMKAYEGVNCKWMFVILSLCLSLGICPPLTLAMFRGKVHFPLSLQINKQQTGSSLKQRVSLLHATLQTLHGSTLVISFTAIKLLEAERHRCHRLTSVSAQFKFNRESFHGSPAGSEQESERLTCMTCG